jgi:DNA-binding MarR family transcriptional regulator
VASDADRLTAAVDAFVTATSRQRIATAATHDDVTPNDLFALACVQQAGELGPGALAKRILLTAGGTGGVIRRLVAAGLLTRTAAPGNHRDVRLCATPAGRALLAAEAGPRDRELRRVDIKTRSELVALFERLTELAERCADAAADEAARAADPAHGVPLPVRWG